MPIRSDPPGEPINIDHLGEGGLGIQEQTVHAMVSKLGNWQNKCNPRYCGTRFSTRWLRAVWPQKCVDDESLCTRSAHSPPGRIFPWVVGGNGFGGARGYPLNVSLDPCQHDRSPSTETAAFCCTSAETAQRPRASQKPIQRLFAVMRWSTETV